MNAATRRTAALVAVLTLAASACAGRRLVDGVYHAASGYRVTVPGPTWQVAPDSRADLELRQPDAPVGMLANAVCDPAVVRRGWDVLSQHLLIGMRAVELLRLQRPDQIHSRKLRGFAEVAFQ